MGSDQPRDKIRNKFVPNRKNQKRKKKREEKKKDRHTLLDIYMKLSKVTATTKIEETESSHQVNSL